jgi:hypothetical protein
VATMAPPKYAVVHPDDLATSINGIPTGQRHADRRRRRTPASVVAARQGFGSWKPTAGRAVTHVKQPAPPQRNRREIYIVDKPGVPQSQIHGAVSVQVHAGLFPSR